MVGKKIGRYTVLDIRYDKATEKSFLTCECECGTVKEVRRDHLTSGRIVSCGCYHTEIAKDLGYRLGKSQVRHSDTGKRLHTIWVHMRQRCYDKNYTKFKYWGGKGISICNDWSTYENFRDWALSNGYSDELTIDRIDGSKNYEPSNCRWATYEEQNKNRSFSKKV